LNGRVDEQQTYRWVADPPSAADAARSFGRAVLSRRRTWLVLAVPWLAFGPVMATALDEVSSPFARVAWGYAWITLIWVVVVPMVLGLVHWGNRRRFAVRLKPGVELTSRFGPSSVELAGPMARSELSFTGLQHVERVGDWVHLRQVASPLILVWPAALFPDHDLDRMQRAVAERRG
jgi:hypothetical protein